MTTLLGLTVLAAVVSTVAWRFCQPMFEAPLLQRQNFRGVDVPVAAGVVAGASVIAVEAILRIVETGQRHVDPVELDARTTTLLLVLGFCLLGAFDDIAAHGDDRGFSGHLRAIARGRLSTGGLKLVAGGLLGIVVVSAEGADTIGDLALGAVLVALAANLGNLFDRAPGRTTKVGLLCGIVLVAVTPAVERPALAGTVVVLGATLGLLVPDLRERLMLGDAGSNVVGAALGFGVVLTTGRLAQIVVVLVLTALNIASEKVSFSKVIAATPPLRFLDRLGRRT